MNKHLKHVCFWTGFQKKLNFLVIDRFDKAVSKRMSSQGSTVGMKNGITMGMEND